MNIEFKKYRNGLKCIFERDFFNDIISINLFYPISMEVEKEIKGVGLFTLDMLFKGTKNLDAHAFALELEKNAINFDIKRMNNYINFSIFFEKKIFIKATDLFFDMLFNPIFDEFEIEKLRKNIFNSLAARYDNISNVCYDEFLKLIYGDENYKSWCNFGTKESIESIKRENLLDFHERYLIKTAPIISVIGNLDFEIFEDKFLKRFICNNNIYNQINTSNLASLKNKDKQKKIKKDFNQAYIMQGFIAPNIKDENFLNLKLINNYLGYGMASVFFEKIREELGLVYEISSMYSNYEFENYWLVYLGLDKKNIDLALNVIDNEIKKFCTKKIDQKELEILKNKTKRYEIFKYEKKSNRCFALGINELLGLGYDYRDKYLQKIDTIPIKSINDTIDALFSGNDKFTVIVE